MAPLIHIHTGSNTIEVDAAIVGEGLKIDPSAVQRLMRESAITSRCERGVAEDAGLMRLTFTKSESNHRPAHQARMAVQRAARLQGETTLKEAFAHPETQRPFG